MEEKSILKMRQEGIYARNHSIYDSHVFIHGERMEFAMQDIFPPAVRVMLPVSFLEMPIVMAREKYPSEYRPKVILTSPDLLVNFAFQYYEERIREEEVATAARYYYSILQKCYSGYGFLECSECLREGEHVLAWYSYSSPTINDTLFHIHAFTAVEGRLLQCIFNAPQPLFDCWKPYASEVFRSVGTGRIL